MPREVVVEYTSGPDKGKTYAVESVAVAKKVHPDAKIVAFHPSGEPYKEKEDTKVAAREARPADAEIEAAQKAEAT